MPATIKYSDNPNEETAFVTQDGGQRNRAVLTAAVDGTIEYPDNPNSTKVFVTVDGVKRRAVAVANISGGGGGGDSHNKGYYTTQAALEEAYPTAEAGDWAIVGATDTVWVWDEDTSAWVDTDTKGEVTPDMVIIKSATMPTPSTTPVGAIYQYTGATNSTYTHDYIYENVSKTTYNGTITDALGRITFDNANYSLGDFFGGLGIANYQNIEMFMLFCMGDPTDADADWAFMVADGDGNALGMPLLKKAEIEAAGFTIDTGSYPPPFQGTISLTGTTANVWEVIETGNQVLQCVDMPFPMPDIVGKVVQYVGTTGKYTNGYFYKCVVVPSEDPDVSDIHAWEQTNVQPTPSGLPDQTGQSGKFLTTDGTDASWGTIDALPTSGGTMTGPIKFTQGGIDGGYIGAQGGYIRVGNGASASSNDLFINTANKNIIFDTSGWMIGSAQNKLDTLYTTKIYNGANISVPTSGGVIALQETTMPTAASGNEGLVVQYVGTTDANYTNGYFYKCVSDGQNPATYSWEAVEVQASSGGLPSQTGQSGKFLTTDGTDASWSDKPLVNKATGVDSLSILGVASSTLYATNVGSSSKASGMYGAAFGDTAYATGSNSVAIGASASASHNYSAAFGTEAKSSADGAIQICHGTNNESNTLKIGLKLNNSWVNYKLLDSDGTIPEARLADTTGASQGDVLTLDSNGDATWAAPSGGGVSSISVTLPAASWSGGSQTVTATGVTASNTVIIGAAPASQAEYTTCGVICTGQGADSLTFTATSTPTNDLSVTVLILA